MSNRLRNGLLIGGLVVALVVFATLGPRDTDCQQVLADYEAGPTVVVADEMVQWCSRVRDCAFPDYSSEIACMTPGCMEPRWAVCQSRVPKQLDWRR